MQKVTIEYLDKNDECQSATGMLMAYCTDGDVKIVDDNKKIIRKGMPVQFH